MRLIISNHITIFDNKIHGLKGVYVTTEVRKENSKVKIINTLKTKGRKFGLVLIHSILFLVKQSGRGKEGCKMIIESYI